MDSFSHFSFDEWTLKDAISGQTAILVKTLKHYFQYDTGDDSKWVRENTSTYHYSFGSTIYSLEHYYMYYSISEVIHGPRYWLNNLYLNVGLNYHI